MPESRKPRWTEFESPALFERRMHFTNEATQSAMLLSDPDALIAQYMRKMMAFRRFTRWESLPPNNSAHAELATA
jgi:hypothetical protein